MGMQYRTGIDFQYKDELDFSNALEIPNECSFSQGSTIMSSEKFGRDYSKTSQGLTRCRRPQAQTYSISYVLGYPERIDLFGALREVEDSAGRIGELWFCGRSFGLVIVKSASIAIETDAASVIAGLSITLEVAECKEPVKFTRVEIRNQRRDDNG